MRGREVAKQRIPASFLKSARLEITRSSTPATEGRVNGHITGGYDVVFAVRVESDLHTLYASKLSVFVAPHDADLETRSVRREGGGKPSDASSP